MTEQPEQNFIFLDGEQERRLLVEKISHVRRSVLNIVENIPADLWYETRYHGWSLAAILGHLNLMDRLRLYQIQLGLLGIPFPIPPSGLNQINNFMSVVFRRRVVETSIQDAIDNEQRIADFITRLPVDKFTRQVYHTESGSYITVERAVQVYFLHHWEEHLRTLRAAEVLEQEPPDNSGMDTLEDD